MRSNSQLPESQWVLFEILPDKASAEAFVGLLEKEGVPTSVDRNCGLPGMESFFFVFVPEDLLERAGLLRPKLQASFAELGYSTIGELIASETEPEE